MATRAGQHHQLDPLGARWGDTATTNTSHKYIQSLDRIPPNAEPATRGMATITVGERLGNNDEVHFPG